MVLWPFAFQCILVVKMWSVLCVTRE